MCVDAAILARCEQGWKAHPILQSVHHLPVSIFFRASGAAQSALHPFAFAEFALSDKRARSCVNKASGFTPPSDDRSRTTRGSDDSAPALSSTGLVPAVSVVRARTQSRPRAQAKAQAGSDGTSTPSPQQQGVSLSAQQATLLAGASIQRAHQASEMASAAASSALQGHQAAVLAQARQRFVESEANQVVDHVRSEARSFGHHVDRDPSRGLTFQARARASSPRDIG